MTDPLTAMKESAAKSNRAAKEDGWYELTWNNAWIGGPPKVDTRIDRMLILELLHDGPLTTTQIMRETDLDRREFNRAIREMKRYGHIEQAGLAPRASHPGTVALWRITGDGLAWVRGVEP